MRALLIWLPVALAGCGPSNSCPNAAVGAVTVTIDGTKDPLGAGECASGTSSNVVIRIGGPQHLAVSLGIGADATGTHECKDGLVTVQLDGDSALQADGALQQDELPGGQLSCWRHQLHRQLHRHSRERKGERNGDRSPVQAREHRRLRCDDLHLRRREPGVQLRALRLALITRRKPPSGITR